jgi:hypothetical protein
VRSRLNDSQRRAKFVRNTRRKFHLKSSKTARTAAGDDQRYGADSEYDKNSKADSQVPSAECHDRCLDRTCAMFDQQVPTLAGKRDTRFRTTSSVNASTALRRQRNSWTSGIAATALRWPQGSKKVKRVVRRIEIFLAPGIS